MAGNILRVIATTGGHADLPKESLHFDSRTNNWKKETKGLGIQKY